VLSLRFGCDSAESECIRSAAKAANKNANALLQPKIIRQTISGGARNDAPRIAKLLGWSLADVGRYLNRDPSTISRSRTAPAHQDRLGLAALIREVFIFMNEDLPATIAWFRASIPALEWASPRNVILAGDLREVRNPSGRRS
jgi:hypothetical protein